MPLGDPSAPLPESEMRIFRPIGLALLALFLGANATLILLPLVGRFTALDLVGYFQHAMYGLSAVFFVLLMRRSRRKRQQAAARAAAGGFDTLGTASVLVAGVLAIALAVVAVWLTSHQGTFDAHVAGLSLVMAGAGVGAIHGGVKRIRAARAKP